MIPDRLISVIQEKLKRSVTIDSNECWVWNRGKSGNRYGVIKLFGENVKAHRVSFTVFKGPIPKDLHVLHSCDNPSCINPDHLFTGTHIDNMIDRDSKGRNFSGNGAKTHCKYGHEFTQENTYFQRRGSRIQRVCRTCNKIWCQIIRDRRKSEGF